METLDIATAKEFMERLVGSDPAAFNDPQSFKTLLLMQTQYDAFVTQVANQFDTWGEWCESGCRTPASWVSVEARVPHKDAGRLIKRGRALSQLTECAAAWARGEINAAHLDRLIRAWNPRTQDALIRDEHMLVEQAKTLSFPDFCRAVDYWVQHADPDGIEEAAEVLKTRRDVYLEPSVDGMFFGKMTLDPISGAIVSNELSRLERQFFEDDWKEAKARLGFDPQGADLRRTPSQRRADVLVEMATRSKMAPENGKRPAPLFSVYVGYETLSGRICQLAQGTVIAPGSLLPWLDQAYIERAVFTPDNRVEVSTTTRLFTGATRRAVELRDRECTHPYCDRPAEDCEIDHIQPYAAKGPTTQDNGQALCGYHNRLKNQRPPPSS